MFARRIAANIAKLPELLSKVKSRKQRFRCAECRRYRKRDAVAIGGTLPPLGAVEGAKVTVATLG